MLEGKTKIYGSLKEKKISLLCTSCQFTYITIEEKFLMCPTLGRGKMGGISGRKEGGGGDMRATIYPFVFNTIKIGLNHFEYLNCLL